MNILTKRLTMKRFTPLAKKLIELAIQNCKDRNHTYVGLTHFNRVLNKLKKQHKNVI